MDQETYNGLPLVRWIDKTGNAIPNHPETPTMRVVKPLSWSSREKKESIQIPVGESHEIIPSIPELEEEEQTFKPLQAVETEKMIPMDSVTRDDSEFSQLEKFVIKSHNGPRTQRVS